MHICRWSLTSTAAVNVPRPVAQTIVHSCGLINSSKIGGLHPRLEFLNEVAALSDEIVTWRRGRRERTVCNAVRHAILARLRQALQPCCAAQTVQLVLRCTLQPVGDCALPATLLQPI
jgi:hypothetical protein